MDKTEKRYWTFLRNGLRRMSLKYPNRYETLNNAKRPYSGANKRQKWEYQCSDCKGWYKGTEVAVDHIKPCGELTSPLHIKKFVLNLFCELKGMQVLCSTCHTKKTNAERLP